MHCRFQDEQQQCESNTSRGRSQSLLTHGHAPVNALLFPSKSADSTRHKREKPPCFNTRTDAGQRTAVSRPSSKSAYSAYHKNRFVDLSQGRGRAGGGPCTSDDLSYGEPFGPDARRRDRGGGRSHCLSTRHGNRPPRVPVPRARSFRPCSALSPGGRPCRRSGGELGRVGEPKPAPGIEAVS
jgi:hypothetical protein